MKATCGSGLKIAALYLTVNLELSVSSPLVEVCTFTLAYLHYIKYIRPKGKTSDPQCNDGAVLRKGREGRLAARATGGSLCLGFSNVFVSYFLPRLI